MKKLIYMFLFAGSFLTTKNLSAQTTTNAAGEVVMIKDSLMKFLFRHSFAQYNVAPNIPKAFEEKKDKYEVPADETVMAYIDASVMANGKFGIVVGLKGLYIFNSKTSDAPGRFFLPYSTYRLSEVRRDRKNELSIGPVKVEIVGLMKDDQNKAEEFFKDLKSKLLK